MWDQECRFVEGGRNHRSQRARGVGLSQQLSHIHHLLHHRNASIMPCQPQSNPLSELRIHHDFLNLSVNLSGARQPVASPSSDRSSIHQDFLDLADSFCKDNTSNDPFSRCKRCAIIWLQMKLTITEYSLTTSA